MRLLKFSLLCLIVLVAAACAPIATELPSPTPEAATVTPLPPTHATTVTPVPSNTATAPPAPTATRTPTAQAVVQPTLGYYNITPAADATLPTAIPTPVNAIKVESNIVNILLVGTDYRASEAGYRTDTLIIASINKDTGDVTLLSIPRDLYVYIPTWGMARINAAYGDGEKSQYAGGGPGLLKQTILYNLGIPIHYYALVNFDGFRQIVDTVGGVDVAVTCQLTEYKIKDPTLDEANPENYELYTQPIGVAHMDGALALWYARARPVGGDFFRGYRQRQVLRGIYQAAFDANLLPQIPQLYSDYREVIESDLGLWEVMQFVPLAAQAINLRSLHIGPNQTSNWRTPRGDDVLVPKAGPLMALSKEVLNVGPDNQLQRALPAVEVWNVSDNPDLTRFASETLRGEGFAPVVNTPESGATYTTTTLIDFTTNPKVSPLKKLVNATHVNNKHIFAQPDANSPVLFRLIVTDDYNPCPRLDWMDTNPISAATATAAAVTPTATPKP